MLGHLEIAKAKLTGKALTINTKLKRERHRHSYAT
jgi:hypothetical protein